jgi:nucleoid-associated protein YgaU
VDAVVSVQRYIVAGRHLFLADKVPMLGGEVVIKEADHARIVAEMERQHAAALAEAVSVIEGLADQQAMYDGWYVEPLERLRAAAAAAPRTLTADDARAAVVRLTEWSAYKHDRGFERAVDEAVIAIDSLIHDGEDPQGETRVPPRTAGGDRIRAYYAERGEEVPRIHPAAIDGEV